jgi:hypothetical protein
MPPRGAESAALYAECSARARAIAASDAAASAATGLVVNNGNLEVYLFLRCATGGRRRRRMMRRRRSRHQRCRWDG